MTEVRAILGIPGASTLSDPISLPAGVRHVYLAPTQQWALVEQDGGAVGLMRFSGAEPTSTGRIAGAMPAPDSFSFSPTGHSAVLVSYATGEVQVLSGLEATPQVAMAATIPNFGAASLRAVAVSDDGTLAAVLNADGKAYLLSRAAAPQLIFQAAGPAGLSFLPNRAAVVIADSLAGTISVVDGLQTSPFTRTVISAPDLSGDRILLQPSGDAQSVFVTALGGKSAYRVDLTNQSVSTLDVPVGISRLERVRDGDVFLFSANPGESPWLLMSDGANLKVGFVQIVGEPRAKKPRPLRPLL
jgi:hypothetical protein